MGSRHIDICFTSLPCCSRNQHFSRGSKARDGSAHVLTMSMQNGLRQCGNVMQCVLSRKGHMTTGIRIMSTVCWGGFMGHMLPNFLTG